MKNIKPISSMTTPRFADVATFFRLPVIKNLNDLEISGYSDHSVGIEVALTAIARGATVIEKHFTLDKSDTTIRDHALSATPDEFKIMVDLGRNIHKNNLIGV